MNRVEMFLMFAERSVYAEYFICKYKLHNTKIIKQLFKTAELEILLCRLCRKKRVSLQYYRIEPPYLH